MTIVPASVAGPLRFHRTLCVALLSAVILNWRWSNMTIERLWEPHFLVERP